MRGLDRIKGSQARLGRLRRTRLVPGPGRPEVEIGPGDEMEIAYQGEARVVRVLGVMPWGLRVWDEGRRAIRAFRFDRIDTSDTGAANPD